MITKLFLKRYDFKVLAYKSLQVFVLFFLSIILFLGLVTYDEFDPSPFSVGDEKPNNLLGAFGANLSSILFFIFGDASWLMIIGFLMLIRIVIITNYKKSQVFLRFVIIFFSSFILSLSFELVS
ncbi:DNA translocase FtsK 4TM domain-containing protein, partial [Alphaproteobacteria bacterium]|nr:DNA translocase FtsK 4TM domain-containing protein [Alphaproteobacteria bacterium]